MVFVDRDVTANSMHHFVATIHDPLKEEVAMVFPMEEAAEALAVEVEIAVVLMVVLVLVVVLQLLLLLVVEAVVCSSSVHLTGN